MILNALKKWGFVLSLMLFSLSFSSLSYCGETMNSQSSGTGNDISVLKAFDENVKTHEAKPTGFSDHEKQVISFLIGAPLLLLILLTGFVGVAMGVYGKPWFLLHMILAGLTISLALVHVVVGLVWFYPF